MPALTSTAVRQWRYKPYLLNGEPVEVDTTVTVNFTLTRETLQTPGNRCAEANHVQQFGRKD
jgi:hypothetical protein